MCEPANIENPNQPRVRFASAGSSLLRNYGWLYIWSKKSSSLGKSLPAKLVQKRGPKKYFDFFRLRFRSRESCFAFRRLHIMTQSTDVMIDISSVGEEGWRPKFGGWRIVITAFCNTWGTWSPRYNLKWKRACPKQDWDELKQKCQIEFFFCSLKF